MTALLRLYVWLDDVRERHLLAVLIAIPVLFVVATIVCYELNLIPEFTRDVQEARERVR